MSSHDSLSLLMSPDGRRRLVTCYRDGLLANTVPFWFPRSIDTANGGFLHCLDRDGSILDTDKSIWAQGRMSWMLLTLYNSIERRQEWLEWAQSGLQFLERFGFDSDGRMFFHVARDGAPVRKRRYAYSEAFAAIAYAAHFKATGSDHSAERARALFDFYLEWNFTPGKMPPKFTGHREMIALAPRMIAIATAQELRANLGDDPGLNNTIDRFIDEIRRFFVKPELKVVMEHVAADGRVVDHFDGRLLNPGHAMEGAWFILREGQHRKNPDWVQLGCQMLDWMWDRGWDAEYGGMFYYRDLFSKPIQEYWHDMKFWWPHNETIIATLVAFELTGDAKYAGWHQACHDWSYRHFSDLEHHEWYGYLHRDGSISNAAKGNLWKSFFHFPRMQWLCSQVLMGC